MAQRGIRAKNAAIVAARMIAQGDASGARKLRSLMPQSLTATDARALIGGARAAKKRYGANIDIEEFLFGGRGGKR